jgi:hypothetical protein
MDSNPPLKTNDVLRENLQGHIEHVLDGNSILFLGAGFSKGAINVKSESFKGGQEFSAMLCRECKLAQTEVRLDDSSELFVQRFGEDKLISILKEQFTTKSHTSDQLDLVRLKWKRIYTTNYDDIVESAASVSGKNISAYLLSDNPSSVDKSKPLCLHINGFVHRLTRDSLSSEIKLTDSSYARSDLFEQSRWSAVFHNDLQIAKAIFFIGYSLYDIDVKRILIRLPELYAKTIFVISTEPNQILEGKVSQYGQIHAIGLSGFVEAVKSIAAHYVPRAASEPIFSAFSRYQPEMRDDSSVRDIDVFKLLLYGDVVPELVWRSASTHALKSEYYLFREKTEHILSLFLDKKQHNVILFSDLGNGKTLLLEGLRCRAHLNNFTVYTLSADRGEVATEIDYICSTTDPVIIIVEDVFANLSILKQIQIHRRPNIFVVLTSRTAVFELYADKLAQIIPDTELLDINLNYLTDREISDVVALLDKYGLWGHLASASREAKLQYIAQDCGREFQAILLGVFKSPAIKAKIDGLFEFLNDKKAFRDFAIAILILDFLGLPANAHILTQLLEKQGFNEISFQRNESIKELLSFNSGMIFAKSAVLARHLLTGLSDGNLVINCLIKMAKRSALLSGTDDTFHTIFRRLGLFSSLQDMLPEKNRRAACVKYFEELKNLELCRNSPHFWLQYAIARVAFEEFEPASTYYENAYSLAEKMPGFDTYHIDNHYARFLIKKALSEDYSLSTMDAFRRAHTILHFQANRVDRDIRYYPYRGASLYREFIVHFSGQLEKLEIEYIVHASQQILACAKKTRRDIMDLPIMEKSRRNLAYVVSHYGVRK